MAEDEQAEAGYVAVDALVALSILATVLAFSFQLGSSAWTASRRASEFREARMALRLVMIDPASTAPTRPLGAFDLNRQLTEERVGEVRLCRVRAEVLSRRSGRRFVQTSRIVCPPADEALP